MSGCNDTGPIDGLGAVSIQRLRLTSVGIPMLKIRRSLGSLIVNMGISIHWMTVFISKWGTDCHITYFTYALVMKKNPAYFTVDHRVFHYKHKPLNRSRKSRHFYLLSLCLMKRIREKLSNFVDLLMAYSTACPVSGLSKGMINSLYCWLWLRQNIRCNNFCR